MCKLPRRTWRVSKPFAAAPKERLKIRLCAPWAPPEPDGVEHVSDEAKAVVRRGCEKDESSDV